MRTPFKRRHSALVVLASTSLVLGIVTYVVASASPASALGITFYAYPTGGAVGPASCPQSTVSADECTLTQALALARAGDTVALAVAGTTSASTFYVGNFRVNPSGTSVVQPLTIEPAAGVHGPIVDGNKGSATNCPTPACDRAVLTIGNAYVTVEGVTIQDGNNTLNGGQGGGIDNSDNGTLVVENCVFLNDGAGLNGSGAAIDNADQSNGTADVFSSTFSGNSADMGGAIASGTNGVLSVSASTFSDNSAVYGGAIFNNGLIGVANSTFSGNAAADPNAGGSGYGGAIENSSNLSLSDSTFSDNSAGTDAGAIGNIGSVIATGLTFSGNHTGGDGGAIDTGEGTGSGGTISLSDSVFTGNFANDGGAINNTAGGELSISNSTFSSNGGYDGGAIDNGDGPRDSGIVTVADSTLDSNNAVNGGAIDNGDGTGTGTVSVTESTLLGNSADTNGGAIDNGDDKGTGTFEAIGSTFLNNSAVSGGAIHDGYAGKTSTATVATDIFASSRCYRAGGTWNDDGYNIATDSTCFSVSPAVGDNDSAGSNLANELAPLSNNGGPTQTLALLSLAHNPAINAIPYNTTISVGGSPVSVCPVTDQRGVASAPGAACDAGAVQLTEKGTLYAYPAGGATSPTSCPLTPTASEQCTLTQAVDLAGAGDIVALAVSGTTNSNTFYRGNFPVDTPGTTFAAPLTIEPATGVTNPILDGNKGSATNCPTSACNGPVLTIAGDVYAIVEGVTIQNGDNTLTGEGGAIDYADGTNATRADLIISETTFTHNTAGVNPSTGESDGGAIDTADNKGIGDLFVADSTFSSNAAGNDGGAIDNGDNGGAGFVDVTASTFSNNSSGGNGGAIESAANTGAGSLYLDGSTFSDNTAGGDGNGGAIDNGDGGQGFAVFTASTFSGNRAGSNGDGGAIENGSNMGGSGTLSLSGCTFSANAAGNYGGAIENGEDTGTGNLTDTFVTFSGNTAPDGGAVSNGDGGTGILNDLGSTFSGNTAPAVGGDVLGTGPPGDGGAILNGVNGGTGTLSLTQTTFTANSAGTFGGAIDNGDNDNSSMNHVTVASSTFTANTAAALRGGGGAISNIDHASVTTSTFSGNTAPNGDGGAIDNGMGGGIFSVTTSTFSGNTTPNGNGGAIDNADGSNGIVSATGSTFVANIAGGNGGAIDNADNGGTGIATVAADIFVASTCDQGSAGWVDDGYNVAEKPSCFSVPPATADNDSAGANLATELGPLSDNSGPTLTIALLSGNPAIGVIPLNTSVSVNGSPVTLCPTTDQRGIGSVAGNPCDAGAVQLQTPSFAITVNGNSTSATISSGQQATLAETGLPAAATGTVTFSSTTITLCSFTLSPSTTSCLTSAALAKNVSGISASFSPTESNDTDATSTNSLSLTVIGPPVKLVFSAKQSSATAGATFAVSVRAKDGSGNIVTTDDTSSVTLAITAGTGTKGSTLACAHNPVVTSSGTATFHCSIRRSGKGYTLTATSPSLTSATGTAFQITAGPASKLAFSGEPPAASVAGAKFAAVVSVEDKFGNVVTTSTAQVSMALSGGAAGAKLSCKANPVTAAGGTAAFSCSIGTAGSGYALTATSTSLASAKSSSFKITAGPPSKLAFTREPPASATASTKFAMRVSVEDSLGNIVTTSTARVSVALSGGTAGAKLSCTANPVTAVGGTAAFICSIGTAGSGYALTATGTSLASAKSSSVKVT